MRRFLRYERVPVWDEEMSDENASLPSTPQHVACESSSAVGVTEQQGPVVSNTFPDGDAATPARELLVAGAEGGWVAVARTASTSSGAHVDEFAPPKLDMSAPPPYSECDDQMLPHVLINMPPSGVLIMESSASDGDGAGADMPSDLLQPPSYEEVQRIKAVEAQLESGDRILLPPHTGNVGLTLEDVVASMGAGEAAAAAGNTRPTEEDLLGTDLLFFLAFAAAFFFSWVGFVVLVCFCHSVAGRSGALAGFGLSLAKWAVIVRHSSVLAKEANTWLLWLIMVLGLVICLRAVLQYLNAKREWKNASPALRHRYLLFH